MFKENKNNQELIGSVSKLNTEQRNMDTIGIDKQSTETMLRWINREDKKVAGCVEEAIPQITKAVNLLYERMNRGGRLIYVGAGTSGRMGYIDAAECPPTFYVPYDKVMCIMAGGRECVFKARENMEDIDMNAAKDLAEVNLGPLDTVVAGAASGRTPYCIGALKYAEEIGAGRISISCNPDSEMSKYAEAPIEVDTGAEVLMYSTRMKAGAAIKFIMNMMSTSVMIKLGYTYDNVFLIHSPNNSKGISRVIRLFIMLTGNEDVDYAKQQLEKANGDLRSAFFMEMYGITYEQAVEANARAENNVKKAIEIIQTDYMKK